MAAAGIAALLCFLFEGPRLGLLYDFLLRRRAGPPVAREILIIDTPGRELGDDILEPGAASTLLYIMTELGARSLIIQVPILGLSAGGTVGEAEILYRFDEEFSILSSNIRNLFDAIRTGSVAPRESARYVGELVELSEKGKERLVSALVRRDTEGIIKMERAAAFFGDVRQPDDLRVQLITAGGEPARPVDSGGVQAEGGGYSRVQRDGDGVLRRIAPMVAIPYLLDGAAAGRTMDHIIFGALKTRFKNTEIIITEAGSVLIAADGPDGTSRTIPLDRNGAVIFELPGRGNDFRRISISDILAYDEADRNLRRLLYESESLGIFRDVEGEKRPDFLYDYALSLREDFTSANGAFPEPETNNRQTWIEARNSYFIHLDDFLSGTAEMNLIRTYEEMIADEDPDSAVIPVLTEMRDLSIQGFSMLREKHGELIELRGKLESALFSSLCILGRGSVQPLPITGQAADAPGFLDPLIAVAQRVKSVFVWPGLTDTEASALLANSILTGRVVMTGQYLYLLVGSLASAFLICLLIKSLGILSTLGMGALLTLLTGIGYSLFFIFSGVWYDPLAPVGAAASGVTVSFLWILIAKGRYSKRFRLAYGPFVSRQCLKSIIRTGKPLPSETITVRSAIVAIKNADPAFFDDTPAVHSRAVLAFQKKTAEIFKKNGGTIIALEEDTVTACFGSPLERVFHGAKRRTSSNEDRVYAKDAPAVMAVNYVLETAGRPECGHLHFGLDIGNCSFMWSAQSGYFALGAPIQRAKLLSRVAGRYNTRIIISAAVNEAAPDVAAKKLNYLKNKDGTVGDAFYGLMAEN
uniref:CHASE2 domain-containing protein n=1 Tax=uncultured bacterium contig00021 TaxID=1181511 RepID=A0A806KPC5_9BACT|nr:hypothetical protein [uncultured bacterium contig00021]